MLAVDDRSGELLYHVRISTCNTHLSSNILPLPLSVKDKVNQPSLCRIHILLYIREIYTNELLVLHSEFGHVRPSLGLANQKWHSHWQAVAITYRLQFHSRRLSRLYTYCAQLGRFLHAKLRALLEAFTYQQTTCSPLGNVLMMLLALFILRVFRGRSPICMEMKHSQSTSSGGE